MAWTRYQLFLAGLMLVTGSINTLSANVFQPLTWGDGQVWRDPEATLSQRPTPSAFSGPWVPRWQVRALVGGQLCGRGLRREQGAQLPAPLPPGGGHVPGRVLLPGCLLPAALPRGGALGPRRGPPAALQPPPVPAPGPLRHDGDQHHVCGPEHDQRLQLPDAARSGDHLHGPLLRGLPGAAAGAEPVAGHPRHHRGAGHCGPGRPPERARRPAQAQRRDHRGPADRHGAGHRLHPDGARGEVCLQAQRAPAAGGRHRGSLWLRDPVRAAGAHVLPPRRLLQRQPPRDAGGRAGRLLPGGPAAAHRPGAAGQRGQHRLLQLRGHQRHQGAERHHPHGAGQPAHRGHLGAEPGAGLGALPPAADPRLPGPPAGDRPLQRAAPPAAEPPAPGPAPGRGGRAREAAGRRPDPHQRRQLSLLRDSGPPPLLHLGAAASPCHLPGDPRGSHRHRR